MGKGLFVLGQVRSAGNDKAFGIDKPAAAYGLFLRKALLDHRGGHQIPDTKKLPRLRLKTQAAVRLFCL